MMLLVLLFAVPGIARAADGVLTIEDGKFTPERVVINKNERLTVTNNTQKRQWIWGQRGNFAFDFRATKDNEFTHEPGQSLTIQFREPGKYFIGNSFDGKMHATLIVGP